VLRYRLGSLRYKGLPWGFAMVLPVSL
jgi:hypothetical protein